MTAEDLAVYLRLAPEFGGTRFGPFEGLEVRLGADPERCHIVLSAALGVVAEHAKLIRQGPQNLILAPADRTATLFLWKQGARRPEQLNTPTAIRPGEAFSLVTPDGPRFIVELDELPEELIQQREAAGKPVGTGRRRLTKEAMAKELKRQAWTTILTNGVAQMAQRAVTFVKSGAIYQPRNIIMMVMLASGWIFGTTASCGRVRMKKDMATTQQRYEACESERSYLDRKQYIAEYGPADLADLVTRSKKLGQALEKDAALRELVWKKARSLATNRKAFEWLLEGRDKRARDFIDWRERVLASEKLDQDTKILAVWLAARPGLQASEFERAQDSEGTDSCIRGPLRMTWRQALHLGLDQQPDAYSPGTSAKIDLAEQRQALLQERVDLVGVPLPESFTSNFQSAGAGTSTGNCVFIEGEDGRTEPAKLLRAVEGQLGPDGPGVPSDLSEFVSVARIAKWWAADIPTVDYRDDAIGFTFDPNTGPGTTLDSLESRGAWVKERTAETIALAMVVPCLARLELPKEEQKALFGDAEDALPLETPCLILNWKLQNDG